MTTAPTSQATVQLRARLAELRALNPEELLALFNGRADEVPLLASVPTAPRRVRRAGLR